MDWRFGRSSVRWRVLVVGAALLLNALLLAVAVHRIVGDEPEVGPVAPLVAPEATEAATTEGPLRVELMVDAGSPDRVTVREHAQSFTALGRLTMQAPTATGVEVRDLKVLADGVSVPAPPRLEDSAEIALPEGTTEIEITYLLVGALDQREPAPEGRALLQISSLIAGAPEGSRATVELSGVTVRNLVCPDRPAEDQLCGRLVDGRWQTDLLPLGEATVIAQIDLPEGVATPAR